MVKRRVLTMALVIAVLVSTWVGVAALSVSAADEQVYHVVAYGETLSGIARMYGVTVKAIVDANKLTNANLIYSGQKLLIPGLAAQNTIYEVKAGDSLLTIAAKYGVTVADIAHRNGLANINVIFVGQKLVIPGASAVTPTPAPTAQAVAEQIIITSPAANAKVAGKGALTVTGFGSSFENVLAVDILDQAGKPIGQGQANVNAEFGQYGPYSGTISITTPISVAQPGRVQVYSISPRDGAIDHLASVTINLQP